MIMFEIYSNCRSLGACSTLSEDDSLPSAEVHDEALVVYEGLIFRVGIYEFLDIHTRQTIEMQTSIYTKRRVNDICN